MSFADLLEISQETVSRQVEFDDDLGNSGGGIAYTMLKLTN